MECEMQDSLEFVALLLEEHTFDLIVPEGEKRGRGRWEGSRSALVLLPC
jgi:hypothetical protein